MVDDKGNGVVLLIGDNSPVDLFLKSQGGPKEGRDPVTLCRKHGAVFTAGDTATVWWYQGFVGVWHEMDLLWSTIHRAALGGLCRVAEVARFTIAVNFRLGGTGEREIILPRNPTVWFIHTDTKRVFLELPRPADIDRELARLKQKKREKALLEFGIVAGWVDKTFPERKHLQKWEKEEAWEEHFFSILREEAEELKGKAGERAEFYEKELGFARSVLESIGSSEDTESD